MSIELLSLSGFGMCCTPVMPVNSFSSGQVRLMNPGVVFHLELIYHRKMLSGNPFGTAVVSDECMDVLRQMISTGGANWIPRLHSVTEICILTITVTIT